MSTERLADPESREGMARSCCLPYCLGVLQKEQPSGTWEVEARSVQGLWPHGEIEDSHGCGTRNNYQQ